MIPPRVTQPRRFPIRALALALASFASLPLAVMGAPAALAQGIQVNKAMVVPMNEGRAAFTAGDHATAKTKYSAALTLAKTPQEILTVHQALLATAEASRDAQGKVAAIEGALATNLLPPGDIQRYRLALTQAYLEAGNTAKAVELSRAYVDQYGGSAGQYIAIANEALKASNSADAVSYAEKAIAASKAAKTKPPEAYYRVLYRAYVAAQQPAKVDEALATLIAEYPKEEYWREYITAAVKEPGFKAIEKTMQLDLYRAMHAAGIKLTGPQKGSMANAALDRGLPNEAVLILQPAIAAGEVGAAGQTNAAADLKNLKDAETGVKTEKAGLAAEEKEVLAKGSGARLAGFGELHMSYGEYAKAIDFMQKGIEKGIADAGEADLARLHLGIAQYKAGQKDMARATWAQIKADNGASVLARSWILISNVVS